MGMGDFHRPKAVGSENSPGVVTRAGVEAEGWNVGPSDHEGRIWRFQPTACGNPIPINGISDQIIEIRLPQLER